MSLFGHVPAVSAPLVTVYSLSPTRYLMVIFEPAGGAVFSLKWKVIVTPEASASR